MKDVSSPIRTLLDHHPVARAPQGLAAHEVFDGLLRLLVVMGNHHPLARCQSIRLHHHRKRESRQNFDGLLEAFRYLEPRGGNAVPRA